MNTSRKFVTTSVAFTFAIVGVTGVIFQFFFKNQVLEKVHGWLGVAMVAAGAIHLIQNWGPMRGHLRHWRVYLLLIPIAAAVCLFAFGRRQAAQGVNPGEVFGKLAAASAENVARVFGKDVGAVTTRMQADGLRVAAPGETIQQIAKENQASPQRILGYFVR